MSHLIALAGRSRSGKGTCALVIKKMCEERGLTFCERQLSGPGKQHLARIFHPDITEDDAVRFFDDLKGECDVSVNITASESEIFPYFPYVVESVSLRQFMQHALQEGARDLWGEDFWTDMVIPLDQGVGDGGFLGVGFEVDGEPADVCVISDLCQVNEAERVKKLGGVLVEVVRTSLDEADEHATENQMMPRSIVSHTIVNDGDLLDLRIATRMTISPYIDYCARVKVVATNIREETT